MKTIKLMLSGITLTLALMASFWSSFIIALAPSPKDLLAAPPIVVALLFALGTFGLAWYAFLRRRIVFLTVTPRVYLMLASACFIFGAVGRWWITR